MAPPNRTQQAADALLSTTSLGSRSLATALAQSSCTSAAAVAKNYKKSVSAHMTQHRNPYNHQPPRGVGGQKKAAHTSSSSSSSSLGIRKASKGIKRPLSNVRGKNDSILPSSTNNNNNKHKQHTHPSASAFDRRNSHDTISKKKAPLTDTDKTLMALLDGGPAKKQKTKKKKSVVTTTQYYSKSGSSSLPNNKSTTTNIGVSKRHKVNNNTKCIDIVEVVMPPPQPSYNKSHTKSTTTNSK